jgi:hypothetical protein
MEMYVTIVGGVPEPTRICRFVDHSIKMGLSGLVTMVIVLGNQSICRG